MYLTWKENANSKNIEKSKNLTFKHPEEAKDSFQPIWPEISTDNLETEKNINDEVNWSQSIILKNQEKFHLKNGKWKSISKARVNKERKLENKGLSIIEYMKLWEEQI